MEDEKQVTIDRLLEQYNLQIVKCQILEKANFDLQTINSDLLDSNATKEATISRMHKELVAIRYKNIRQARSRIMRDKWRIIILVAFTLFNTFSGIRYLYKTWKISYYQPINQTNAAQTTNAN